MFRLPSLASAVLISLALAAVAAAQSLTLDNDIQTHAALPNTTVTLTGRSELRITGTSSPISGSTIHLNSPDAWFFMTRIRPATVNSSYLGQIRISGAAAVLNSNCRVVQYGEGTVVIPHSSSFRPLTVYTGQLFTGTSSALLPYVAYSSANFGLANQVRSFKLKRGYMATIAQNDNGTGASRNYVAADGDLEVAVMPSSLDDNASFVRIYPWRWVTKKGSCDVDPTALNATWHYNWNISKNSALNWEYVAIKQQPNWPSLSQNWQTRGVSHLLGFNEPNNPVEDSYKNLTPVGSASNAAARWPELLGTGLRIGAPAVTDGGYNWLRDFMAAADAAGHRVDYVPVHYYRSYWNKDDAAGAANQMYSFLKGIYDLTKRPIWVTEFNNGANWTDNSHDPNTTQNRHAIEAMVEMMDSTPWIERYAVYSNVEWFRQTHFDDGSLTPMGTMYRDHTAPLAYRQVIPECPTPIAAMYRMDGNISDSSGNGHAAMTKGAARFVAGKSGQALALSGVAANDDHVQLSPKLGDWNDFSFTAWVWWDGGGNWQRIFDLGNGTASYMFLTPKSGTGTFRFGINNGSSTQIVESPTALPVGAWTHVAVTLSNTTAKLFVNGAVAGTTTGFTHDPNDVSSVQNFLGKSQWSSDPLFAGLLDEVQFLPYALSDAQVAAVQTNTPPQFVASAITKPAAAQGTPYAGQSLAGSATDGDEGDAVSYSKRSGPAWLAVAADGALSGTPPANSQGSQEFVVVATDTRGATAAAVLTIEIPLIFGNGTWTAAGGGAWGDNANWASGFIANGSGNTADFSTLSLPADATVTLDSPRTLGALSFGATAGYGSWTLDSPAGSKLTLQPASGAPVITVKQNTAILQTPLVSTAGLDKAGSGTLVLAGVGTVIGTLNIDTASTSADQGAVRLAHPNAATSLSTIQIRNNNSGSSTLELDGTQGTVFTPAVVVLSGRNNPVPAIRQLGGSSRLGGTIQIVSGGSDYRIESLAGRLELGTGISLTSAATGTRNITLQGSGEGAVLGSIENGSATTVHVAKTGSGKWTLEGAQSYTGTTTVTAGELVVNGTTGAGDTTLATATTLSGGGTVRGNLSVAAGATIRVGEQGFPLVPDPVFALVDDFQSYLPGGIGATPNTTGNIWTGVHNGTANAVIVDDAGDQAMAVNGTGSAWRGAITDLRSGRMQDSSLPHGATGTYFFRVRSANSATTDFIFGLSDQPASTSTAPGNDTSSPWDEYAATLSIGAGNLRASTGGSGTVDIAPVVNDTWLNVWMVVDNAAKTFRVATSSGTNPGTLSGATVPFGRRLGSTVGSKPLVTFGMHERANVAGQIDDIHFVRGQDLSHPFVPQEPRVLPRAATLSVSKQFTLPAGATLAFDVSSGLLHDRLVVGGNFNAAGTLKVTLDPAQPAPASGDSFDLFDAAGGSIAFGAVELPALAPGLSWETAGLASGVIRVTGTALTGYAVWNDGYPFPAGTDGATADAEADGIPNAIEWLLGTDPLVADTAALPAPVLRTVGADEFPGADPTGSYLAISARVRKNTPGWTLVAQAAAAPDLLDAAGSSAGIHTRQLEDLGEFEIREWIRMTPAASGTAGFMRLRLRQD